MLSKSDLASFRQCPRKLWLEHRQPDAASPASTDAVMRARAGTQVGKKARERLGPDILWPRHHDDPEVAAAQALHLLRTSPRAPAVEVPMLRGGLYARADALIPTAGGYVLQETKASGFPLGKDKVTPGDAEAHLLDDVAIQAWVFESTGFALVRAELNLLDNQWRYPGDGDFSGMFRALDVTIAIDERIAQVPEWLTQANAALRGGLPPGITGRHCSKPHPCAFSAHCQRLDPPAPPHPLSLLPGSSGKGLATRLQATRGYTSLLEPAPEELTGKLAGLFRRIQHCHRSGQPYLGDEAATTLGALPYPRYYFDFEGVQLAVPAWPGLGPNAQVTFQWSCHIERAPGEFEHEEFLDLSGEDPSLRCIEAMLRAIPPDDDGPIVVYHQQYERDRMRELAERHPQHAEALHRYVARLLDLEDLVRQSYYHPGMRGSFSIKRVLPTIAPELDYAALGEVHDGAAAQAAYLEAAFDAATPDSRRLELRGRLLEYCKLDTWAMVVVARHLQGGATRP